MFTEDELAVVRQAYAKQVVLTGKPLRTFPEARSRDREAPD